MTPRFENLSIGARLGLGSTLVLLTLVVLTLTLIGIVRVNSVEISLTIIGDRATQQNAALVEQASAAADSLRDQAQHLAELVSVRLPGTRAISSGHRLAIPA